MQERNRVGGWCLAVILVMAASAWAQVTPREYAYTLRSTSVEKHGGKEAPSLSNPSQAAQELTVADSKSGAVPDSSNSAVNDLPAHDKIVEQELTPCGGSKEMVQVIATPARAGRTPPTTMTVRTAALLELHSMRQSAVDLCLQLPTKYRTQLPQCADIFMHEIRLKALAKEH